MKQSLKSKMFALTPKKMILDRTTEYSIDGVPNIGNRKIFVRSGTEVEIIRININDMDIGFHVLNVIGFITTTVDLKDWNLVMGCTK